MGFVRINCVQSGNSVLINPDYIVSLNIVGHKEYYAYYSMLTDTNNKHYYLDEESTLRVQKHQEVARFDHALKELREMLGLDEKE